MRTDEIIDAFENLRVWQQKGKRAPHKPLLALLALGKLLNGETDPLPYSAIEKKLQELLENFGPSSAPNTPHLPFWHLHTDADGQLWKLEGPEEVLARPRGTAPGKRELREKAICGHFPTELQESLKANPVLTKRIITQILHAHFPETLHNPILQETGLSLDLLDPNLATDQKTKRRRDPDFRPKVLRAYEYRCCICNHNLRLANTSVGLEAAHIRWVQADGPDEETNGLSFCATHHTLFDYGAFTIDPKSHYVVFSQEANAAGPSADKLLSYHGAPIIPPQSEAYRPASEYLEWHRDEVFKKPGREV